MYRLSGRFVGGRSRRTELAFSKVAELFAAETPPIVWSVAYAYGAADIRVRAPSKARSRPSKLARMLAASEKCHETEESEMTTPGFTAEASVYASQNRYLTGLQGSGLSSRVALAGSCTCTDPGCTFSCPSPPPPPDCTAECAGQHFPQVTQRCCDCNGGIWDSVHHQCF
jgi:hypothetical protein